MEFDLNLDGTWKEFERSLNGNTLFGMEWNWHNLCEIWMEFARNLRGIWEGRIKFKLNLNGWMGFEWQFGGNSLGICFGFERNFEWNLNWLYHEYLHWMQLNGIWMEFELNLNCIWIEFEWSGIELNGIDLNGMGLTRMEWNGIEWNGTARMDRNGMELNGIWT